MNSRIPNIVHYIQGTTLWASKGSRILVSRDSGAEWITLCELPVGFGMRVTTRSAIFRRLLRLGVHHLLPLPGRLVVFGNREIYCFDLEKAKWEPSRSRIVGSRPLSVCITPQRVMYYGEYHSNPEREPVSIFGSFDGGTNWQSIYSFSGVRHVHGVFYDDYEDCLWVTTGDNDRESAIWKSHNHFQTIEPILSGGQQTRAVQLVFSKRYVYFGSDTPLEINHIYRLNRRSGQLQRIQEVHGSVFWGCCAAGWVFFSTAVEPSERNQGRQAELWGSPDGINWRLVASFSKDFWPFRYFQYGQIKLPQGYNQTGRLWFTPFATERDQSLLTFKLSERQ